MLGAGPSQRAERDQVSMRRRELQESLRTAKEEESRYRRELEELRTELNCDSELIMRDGAWHVVKMKF